jgi:hypothetical protein
MSRHIDNHHAYLHTYELMDVCEGLSTLTDTGPSMNGACEFEDVRGGGMITFGGSAKLEPPAADDSRVFSLVFVRVALKSMVGVFKAWNVVTT